MKLMIKRNSALHYSLLGLASGLTVAALTSIALNVFAGPANAQDAPVKQAVAAEVQSLDQPKVAPEAAADELPPETSPVLAAKVPAPAAPGGWPVQDLVFGSAEATAGVTIWIDLAAPEAPAQWASIAPLLSFYLQKDGIRLEVREITRTPISIWAGLAARGAGKEAYLEAISALMEGQKDWIDLPTEQGSAVKIIDMLKGKLKDVDEAGLRKAFGDRDLAAALQKTPETMEAEMKFPAYMQINGRNLNKLSPEGLRALVDPAL